VKGLITAIGLLIPTLMGGCMQTGSYGYAGYGSPAIQAKPQRCLPPLGQYCRHPDSMPERHNGTQYGSN